MDKLIVVGAQINPLVGDINGNAERIIDVTRQAYEEHKADVVLFPELTLSGYPPEDLLLRSGFYTRCNEAMEKIVRATKDTTIIVGYPDKEGEFCYNKAAVIQDGKIIATYAKHLLPNYTVFDEKRYFEPGTIPCVFNLKGVNIGVTICEDLWHEGPACQSVEAGAQIILSLNASPYDRNKTLARQNMLERRIEKVHVPIVYVNMVGGQDELVFDGGSMVVDKDGKHCQQAAYYQETLMPVEINLNPDNSLAVKHHELPQRLTVEENIYQALVLGVRDYVNKNHFPGAILGLSGGIDSALTLAIAVDALGADRVHAVMMPSRFTASMSQEDAKKQAKTMGVQYDIIEIESLFEGFLSALSKQFAGTEPGTPEENIQARIRGSLLMAISNKKGAIVLTTGNKSEFSVGYATLYGDMAGGFSVLKDIPKTMVYRLAEYRNTISEVIPDRVIEREPSAELSENQRDQDTLPPYPVLDEILHRFIEKDEDPRHIYTVGLDRDTVNRVVTMVNQNEYKRRQAPIGIRTTERAFGKDRRYPITSGYTKNI